MFHRLLYKNNAKIEEIIINDDIKSLQDFIDEQPNFNVNLKIYFSCPFLKRKKLISVVCYYGAINRFKYLILNQAKFNETKICKNIIIIVFMKMIFKSLLK